MHAKYLHRKVSTSFWYAWTTNIFSCRPTNNILREFVYKIVLNRTHRLCDKVLIKPCVSCITCTQNSSRQILQHSLVKSTTQVTLCQSQAWGLLHKDWTARRNEANLFAIKLEKFLRFHLKCVTKRFCVDSSYSQHRPCDPFPSRSSAIVALLMADEGRRLCHQTTAARCCLTPTRAVKRASDGWRAEEGRRRVSAPYITTHGLLLHGTLNASTRIHYMLYGQLPTCLLQPL